MYQKFVPCVCVFVTTIPNDPVQIQPLLHPDVNNTILYFVKYRFLQLTEQETTCYTGSTCGSSPVKSAAESEMPLYCTRPDT